MADPITIRAALDLRPEDAIRAFRQRDELAISVSYRDLEPEEHARAFTAAKVAKLDILEALGGSLDVALRDGQTFAQWRDGILPTLQREGWWGLIQDEALTGTSEPVFVGERRLRTIFATNMRVSRAAGQWARIQAVKAARPFLRYSAVLDNRTRPLHARWHGIIRPVDDPIWQTIYPPNGWNCRCQVQQLSQRDLDRRGLRVTPDSDLPDLGPTGSAWFGGRAGNSRQEGQPRQRRDVIRGIDAGWDYNPGAQSFAGLVARAAEVLAKAEAAGLDLAAAEVREAILAELGQVLGRTVALALLAQLAPAAMQIEAASRRGKWGKSGIGSSGVSAETRAKLSQAAKGRRRVQGRFADEPGLPRGPADRGEIRRMVRRALNDRRFQARLPMGPATDLRPLAKDSRYSIFDYRRVIDAHGIRHAWDGHKPGGTRLTEATKHLALSRRDFEQVTAIREASNQSFYRPRKHTTDRIEHWSEYEGQKFILVEEVRPRVGEIAFKTLYKVDEFPVRGTRRA
ncbi:MAG: phage minor head protein [Sandaracinobacter sp.]